MNNQSQNPKKVNNQSQNPGRFCEVENKQTPALNERFFLKRVTHPTKVSRHREAPMRAPKIKISFMFAGSQAGPSWQRGIYTELYFPDQTHPIEPIAPCDRVHTFIGAFKANRQEGGRLHLKKKKIFSTDTSKPKGGGVGPKALTTKMRVSFRVFFKAEENRDRLNSSQLSPGSRSSASPLVVVGILSCPFLVPKDIWVGVIHVRGQSAA